MDRRLAAGLVLISLPLVAAPALPAFANDSVECRTEGPAQLAACDRRIADPAIQGQARVEALLFHAEAIRRTGDAAGSLADLRQAEALAPDAPSVLIHLAKFFYDERKLSEAEDYIRRAAAAAPADPVPPNVWGKIHFRRGDYRAAIASFRRTIALEPGHANAHWNLANALYKTGDLGGALVEYQMCEKLYPRGRQQTNAAIMAAEVRSRLAAAP